MTHDDSVLKQISLVTNHYGDARVFAEVLQDWFRFLGGRPGEVVVVDCGSDRPTQAQYWQLYQAGWIDKLQIIQPNHADNAGGKATGFIQEYTAGLVASNPYILWFHADTLPYREGHDDWLAEAFSNLDRDDIFAITGSFNLPSKYEDAGSGWYFSRKCSLNFALMKRSDFMRAVHDFAGPYIDQGFQGVNPAAATGQSRFLLEVAIERYLEQHQLLTLCKLEDPTWSIFHTNLHEDALQRVRQQYLARQGIQPYLNIGASDAAPDPTQARYYGQTVSLLKQIRIKIGASSLGPYWRSVKYAVKKWSL